VSGGQEPDSRSAATGVPSAGAPVGTGDENRATPAGTPMWVIFAGLAGAIVVVDQLTKSWLVSRLGPGESMSVAGDLVRFVHSRNTGGLFGLFQNAAPIFAAASIVVLGLIVWYHGRSGRSPYMSLTLGLLLGGAMGNLVDRLRFGYVVDWVDAGIGNVRWYTFNVADAAISASLVLLVILALRPSLAEPRPRAQPARPTGPAAPSGE
jgi:signal peptidase II